ncbi:MAG: hypothetical protein SFV81_06620 [Pirellulaceae bacterium]|nr:hypothetical protein [Pirellulaceae bacterium]
MKDRERIVITGILSLLILGWLGFLVHSSPRFAGSGMGAVFGIAGAVLMLISLAYPIVKRTPFINAIVTKHVSMQTQLTVHVYAGIFGPVLAIIHTGHKYESWLGILLTAFMLLVVVSGFAARYLLTYANQEVKDKLLLLQTARGDLDHAWGVLENTPVERRGLPNASLFTAGLASVGIDVSSGGSAGEVTRLAESVADLEYAVKTHQLFKRWFARSLKLHIVLSIILYVLLGLHIWAAIHLGLRWSS